MPLKRAAEFEQPSSKKREPLACVSRFESPALTFTIWKRSGRTRVGTLRLPHALVETPAFMPVGTHGTIKMLPSEIVEELGPQLILGNTYHLGSQPGASTLQEVNGLHKFMGWKRALLTDSGGFQMVSLSRLSEVQEEGVRFRHPETQEELVLTPEESIRIQNAIGADVIMALDDVVSVVEPSEERLSIAVDRTTRWLDRCFRAHAYPDKQNLWPIVQGGLYPHLRMRSIEQLTQRPATGYAIGGLSGGESKQEFWQTVGLCTAHLPQDRTRYLMGVGYPLDVLICATLGCDLFDCVYPTRTARFGTALTDEGLLRLKKKQYATDFRSIDSSCDCETCELYSRAFLHTAIMQPSTLALLSIHNLRYMHLLGARIRQAIREDTLELLIRKMLASNFPPDTSKGPPAWMRDALVAAGYSEAPGWFAWDATLQPTCGQAHS